MKTERTCPKCGVELPADAPKGICPKCLVQLGEDLMRDTPVAQDSPILDLEHRTSEHRRFRDYELLEEIARGGMGIVYKARQVRLNRILAVKMILSGRFASPEFVQRFQAEAEAAASLQHPNIVAIHELGEHDGQPFFSMDYVPGRNLAQLISEFGFALSDFKRATRYLKIVAEAVHYAHQHGVLHRDLKPSNILIDELDEPRITDFGLAKRLTSDSDLTITGQTLGSPNFMPPEQIGGMHGSSGAGARVGPHSDVYSLGAILYHLLTRRPPFVADTVAATLNLVIGTEPIAPRLLNPAIPKELETICLKCLAKEPHRRYASAQLLADELGRFLNDEPIHARPIGQAARFVRWLRRKPAVAAALSAVLVLIVVIALGIAGVFSQWHRAEAIAKIETAQRQRAETLVYRLEMLRVREFFANDQMNKGLAILGSLLRQRPEDRVAAEWAMAELIQRNIPLPSVKPFIHEQEVYYVEFSPDGRTILTASLDNSARVWDAQSGKPITPPLQHDYAGQSTDQFLQGLKPLFTCFSPDGKKVATASVDNVARIWDASTGQLLTAPLLHTNWVTYARFSPDGGLLATAGKDGTVRFWDSLSGHPASPTLRHAAQVNSVEFSPDGKWVLTASHDRTAQVWEVQTGLPIGQRIIHRHWVKNAQFSPDGLWLVTASEDNTARIWNSRTGEPSTPPLQHEGQVNIARFSPDGLWVITASHDRTARIWDAFTGERAGEPLRHDDVVRSVQFSPDGQRVLTASEDKTVRLWDFRSGRPLTEPMRHQGRVWSAVFSPDAQSVVSASSDKTAQAWDVRFGKAIFPFLKITSNVRQVRWSPNGRRVLAAAHQVRLWPAGEKLGFSGIGLREPGYKGEFSRDSTRVITAATNYAQIWDCESARVLVPKLQHDGAVNGVDFSPDGHRVATASSDRTVRLWSVETGQKLGPDLQHPGAVHSVRFDSSGKLLLSGCADGRARVWNAHTGKLVSDALTHEGAVLYAEFSPDDRHIVTASEDASARVWDSVSMRSLGQPLRHRGSVHSARFSKDGRLVVTASRDNTARVWDAQTCQPIADPLEHRAEVNSAMFSSDGTRVVTASSDSTAQTWDVRTGHALGGPLRHARAVNWAEFSPDGKWIVTGSGDQMARMWHVPNVTQTAPDWLAELLEAVAGQRINKDWIAEPVSPAAFLHTRDHLNQITATDDYVLWGKWFVADRFTRNISPIALKTAAMHFGVGKNFGIDRSPDLPHLREMTSLVPTNGLIFAQMAQVVLQKATTNDVREMREADWLTLRAVALAPDSQLPWQTRAIYLDLSGDLSGALKAMERGSNLEWDHWSFGVTWARMLEKAGRIDDAYQAVTRTPSPGFESQSKALELLKRAGRFAEARTDFLAINQIPSRATNTPSRLIDLTSFYSAGLETSRPAGQYTINTLAELPRGVHSLDGIEFDIRGLVQLSSSRLRQAFPERADGIPVNLGCHRIHFLHATDVEVPDGTRIGACIIRYADGKSTEIPIIYGQDLCAWDLDNPPKTAPPIVAWRGRNQVRVCLQLFRSTWENPLPNVEIKSIDLLSSMTPSAPFVVAISAE